MDDRVWGIRYLVVDTEEWWGGQDCVGVTGVAYPRGLRRIENILVKSGILFV
jgi:hypothetical protein